MFCMNRRLQHGEALDDRRIARLRRRAKDARPRERSRGGRAREAPLLAAGGQLVRRACTASMRANSFASIAVAL
jgi:hypothetical protein